MRPDFVCFCRMYIVQRVARAFGPVFAFAVEVRLHVLRAPVRASVCEHRFPCLTCRAGRPGSCSPRFAVVARGAVLVGEHPWMLHLLPGAAALGCCYVCLTPCERNPFHKKNKICPASFLLDPLCLSLSASSLPAPLARAVRSSSLGGRGSRLFGLRGPSSSPRLDAAPNICAFGPQRGPEVILIGFGPPLFHRRSFQ